MLAYQPIKRTSSGYTLIRSGTPLFYTYEELANSAALRKEAVEEAMALQNELRNGWNRERVNHRHGVRKTPDVNVTRSETKEGYEVHCKVGGTSYMAVAISDESIRSEDGLGLHLLDLIFTTCRQFQNLLNEKAGLH